MMREWLELPSESICKECRISATNLWVILHRARLRLRECLQARWFAGRPVDLSIDGQIQLPRSHPPRARRAGA